MNKRYYVKRGASYRETLRCPLCGKLSPIGYFNQMHHFGVYRFCFAGRGKISCELVVKDISFMQELKESIIIRFLDLLKHFSGQRYYSQEDINILLIEQRRLLAKETLSFVPPTFPKIKPVIKCVVKPYKVVVE